MLLVQHVEPYLGRKMNSKNTILFGCGILLLSASSFAGDLATCLLDKDLAGDGSATTMGLNVRQNSQLKHKAIEPET